MNDYMNGSVILVLLFFVEMMITKCCFLCQK